MLNFIPRKSIVSCLLVAGLASGALAQGSALLDSQSPAPSLKQAVRFKQVKSAGHWANVVTVDLNNPDICIVPVRAEDIGEYYASFGSFVRSWKPLAAINGTFFDTQTAAIICNLVTQGRLITPGVGVGNSLVIDYDNRARMLGTGSTQLDWSHFDFGVSSGPTLVRNGRVAIDAHREGFRDPSLFRNTRRSALGITRDNKLLMVTVNESVSLSQLAGMMKGLGAREALNLDGGSSTGLYCRGRYPTTPNRMMTNLLLVKQRDQAGPTPHRVDDLLIWLTDPPTESPAPASPGPEFVGPAPVPTHVDLTP